jgi:hypothetical protein
MQYWCRPRSRTLIEWCQPAGVHSAFWNKKLIPEAPWRTLADYPPDGEAQIAENDHRPPGADHPPHPTDRAPG